MSKLSRNDRLAIQSRVKSARMMSGLTRKDFSRKSRISIATLRSWEEPFQGRSGITSNGATIFIRALGMHDVLCTEAWLLRGEGPGPRLINLPPRAPAVFREDRAQWSEEESILKDIESFKLNNTDSIVMLVGDDTMSPYFNCGDYVGGHRMKGADIAQLLGRTCIVETNRGLFLRKLAVHLGRNRYTLAAENTNVIDSGGTLCDLMLHSAAEVIWHRWRRCRVVQRGDSR